MTATTTSCSPDQVEQLRTLASELIARDRWSRGQLIAHQRERLEALLRFAATASPYYGEVLSRKAATRPVALAEIPTLPKATLMDEFDRIVTDPRLRLADLEAHLTELGAARPFLGEYRIFSTSGTSGVRGLFVYRNDEFALWIAAALRTLARIGVTPATRLVAIGAPNPLHITKQIFAALQAGRQEAPQLSVTTPLPEMVEALNAYRPEALIAYSSLASMLAEEQEAGRLRIAPVVVAVGSDVLTEDIERRIDQAWGVRPCNVYAATEALLASGSPEHVGLHVSDDLVVLEVVDERNRPVPPATPGYKVLLTTLMNRAQPLIRYELSDSVTLAEGADPSGRPYQRIARVDGRSDDILRFAAKGGGEVAVHPYRLRAPFARVSDVRQYQIVQDERGLYVRVVLRPSAPDETVARIRAALARELDAAGVLPFEVVVEPVPLIEREGQAAKFKLVKSNVGRGDGAPPSSPAR